jgi:hypothetical protein
LDLVQKKPGMIWTMIVIGHVYGTVMLLAEFGMWLESLPMKGWVRHLQDC